MSFSGYEDLLEKVHADRQILQVQQQVRANTGSEAWTNGGSGGFFLHYFEGLGGSWSGTAGAAVAMDDSLAGALAPIPDVSPATVHLLHWWASSRSTGNRGQVMMLVDFLLYYPGLDLNTPTTLDNTVTLPRYTTGDDVLAMPFLQASASEGSIDFTLTYTNHAGTGSRTTQVASSIPSGTGNPKLGLMPGPTLLPQGTDRGFRQFDSYTIATGRTSCTMVLVLFKVLAVMGIPTGSNYEVEKSLLHLLPRVEQGACLGFVCGMANSNNGSIHPEVITLGWG